MKTKEKVYEFTDKQKTAFIASIDEEGFPTIKAMFAPRKREDNCFFFSTNTSAQRTQQYLKNPKASIYFYARTRFGCEGYTLTGTMELLEDAKIKEELWAPGDHLYYPKGVTDPDYCILKFTAQRCRYYHNLKKGDIDMTV